MDLFSPPPTVLYWQNIAGSISVESSPPPPLVEKCHCVFPSFGNYFGRVLSGALMYFLFYAFLAPPHFPCDQGANGGVSLLSFARNHDGLPRVSPKKKAPPGPPFFSFSPMLCVKVRGGFSFSWRWLFPPPYRDRGCHHSLSPSPPPSQRRVLFVSTTGSTSARHRRVSNFPFSLPLLFSSNVTLFWALFFFFFSELVKENPFFQNRT